MKFFKTLSFWLWQNLIFPVWTYSIISRCYYKCYKLILCRMRKYLYLWNILLPVFMFWLLSIIDGGSSSESNQSGHKLSVDTFQPLSLQSGYSMILSIHCPPKNVCKSARFRCSSVLSVSGINRELFYNFDIRKGGSL